MRHMTIGTVTFSVGVWRDQRREFCIPIPFKCFRPYKRRKPLVYTVLLIFFRTLVHTDALGTYCCPFVLNGIGGRNCFLGGWRVTVSLELH
eukprot:4917652-Amphidinium_carterae.1